MASPNPPFIFVHVEWHPELTFPSIIVPDSLRLALLQDQAWELDMTLIFMEKHKPSLENVNARRRIGNAANKQQNLPLIDIPSCVISFETRKTMYGEEKHHGRGKRTDPAGIPLYDTE